MTLKSESSWASASRMQWRSKSRLELRTAWEKRRVLSNGSAAIRDVDASIRAKLSYWEEEGGLRFIRDVARGKRGTRAGLTSTKAMTVCLLLAELDFPADSMVVEIQRAVSPVLPGGRSDLRAAIVRHLILSS